MQPWRFGTLLAALTVLATAGLESASAQVFYDRFYYQRDFQRRPHVYRVPPGYYEYYRPRRPRWYGPPPEELDEPDPAYRLSPPAPRVYRSRPPAPRVVRPAPRLDTPGYSPTRQVVADPTGAAGGTIVVDTRAKYLYFVLGDGKAMRYGIGVGREGFGWKGETVVGRKAEWPDWHPPAEMRQRQPYLPAYMPGGPKNPLGARALYLHQDEKDTLFRIHGTFETWSIGRNVSSGCIRLLNDDVIDLYDRVPVGARVIVR
jgi:lipoprotein-anchoring transpeptidase ErfK/SrfK